MYRNRLLAKNRDRLTVLGPMVGAAKAVTALNEEIDRVTRDLDKTPAQKRAEIDKLLGERNVFAREGVEQSRKETAFLEELKKVASGQ